MLPRFPGENQDVHLKLRQAGIQIFDCSRAYQGSEQRLARALKDVPRNKFFLITKIDDQSQFTGKVKECFEESLKQLQTDYVDLLLLHWPVDYPKTGDKRLDDSVPVYARSWHELEQIFKSGGGEIYRSGKFQHCPVREIKGIR